MAADTSTSREAAVKILTATSRTQGQRRNDFYWLTDGEPVYLGSQCDSARVDDHCGCARSWAGMNSHKAGTTAEVTETSMTREQYVDAYLASMNEAGWGLDRSDAEQMAGEMLRIAEAMPQGLVIEHRGRNIQARRPAPAGSSR